MVILISNEYHKTFGAFLVNLDHTRRVQYSKEQNALTFSLYAILIPFPAARAASDISIVVY